MPVTKHIIASAGPTFSLEPPASLWTTGGDAFLYPHLYSKKCAEFSKQIIHKTHRGRTPRSSACNSAVKMIPRLPSKSGCVVSEVANITAGWSVPPTHAQHISRPSVCHTSYENGWREQAGLQTTLLLRQSTTYGTAWQRPVALI